MWNFQGEVYDSLLDENFEVMYMWGVEYEPSIEGVGYHFQIQEDKSFRLEKMVHRNK